MRNATKLFMAIIAMLLVNGLEAQDFNMNNTTDTTCSGNFYDSGGPSGYYGNSQNYTKTFYSGNGNRLQFNFQSFTLYYSYDYLRIYDGPSTAYPIIGTYYSTDIPGLIESSGEALTFKFYSSSSGNSHGWHAIISCTTAPLPSYNMSTGTLNLCEGVVYDPGGPSSNYITNDNQTQTFAATSGQLVKASFNKSAFGLAAGDTLFIYDGGSTASPLLATLISGSIPETVTSSSNYLTFNFSSDISSTSQGWQAFIECTTTPAASETFVMSAGTRHVCQGVFTDPGGPSGNYPNSSTKYQTFQSYDGNRILFDFTQFNLYYSYDYLQVFDGPSTSYPIIGTYYSTSNPGTIISSGAALTFKFYASSSNNSSGWQANISCAGPVITVYNMESGTDSLCSGVFYDHGGSHGNYPDYESRTHTFCSETGDKLEFTFNQNTWGLQSGDSLFVFDGDDLNDPALAVFVNGSNLETLTSTGSCMTFYFKSNETSNSSGWQAWVECTNVPGTAHSYRMSPGVRYVCSGSFTDNGGSTGNYSDNQSVYTTFKSYSGERLKFDFSQFQMYSSSDYLRIYDGPSNAYPILGQYSTSGSPGVITSSGDALTFYFYSSSSGNSSGWNASISCAGPVLPVYNMNSGTDSLCSGVFYDHGGNHGNYPDYENRTHTFCSETGDMLEFTFNQTTWGMQSSDSLFVFDGDDVTDPALAVFVNGSNLETLTSTGSCMTFYFKSNEISNSRGWQSWIECTTVTPGLTSYRHSPGVRYVCSGNYTDNGGSTGNYSDNQNSYTTFKSYSGERLQFDFSQFQMYSSIDYLRIYDGPSNAYPQLGQYSTSSSPGVITSSGNALTFYFYSSSSGNSSGWNASISCAGPVLPVYNMNSGTDSLCSGVFYDHGGNHGNYPDYENRTHTFCSETGDMLEFTFNQTTWGMQGSDSLFVYDGDDINSPALAVFVSGSNLETLTSSGSCMTFYFKSNEISNSRGWQSWIECTAVTPGVTTYRHSPGVRYVCNGAYTDDGGLTGSYSHNQNKYSTFRSYSGERLQFDFTQFQMYSSIDYMRIYDGPSNAYPLLGQYTTSNSPGVVTSSGDALTFYFYSSSSGNSTGWHANISCAGPTIPVYNMASGTDSLCSGVFYDQGGNHGNYPDYEDRTHTFCSETGDMLEFTFNQSTWGMQGSDTLFVFDGADINAPALAAFISGSNLETLTSTGSCMTFYFKSNETSNSRGWQSWIECTSTTPSITTFKHSPGIRYVCSGAYTDDGGLTGNYNHNQNKYSTFKSYSGERLEFDFTQFQMYSSIDYIKIYDGPSNAYPLIGHYTTNNSPGTITSSGDALTFYFYSSSSGNSSGWHANISCAGPVLPVFNINDQSNSTCEGVFYDHNGPGANYSSNQDYYETFCSGTGDHLCFVFNNNTWGLASGDTLFVYDGSSTAAPILGAYINNSWVEDISSSGNCLTFEFRSDNTNTNRGWQAFINCDTIQAPAPNYRMSGGIRYVCDGTFTDNGGPSGSYSNSLNQYETFASFSGDHIRFDFTSFYTYSSSDKLYIYDGWNTSAPLIGTYYGSNNPGVITSTGDAITFRFYSSSSGNSSGWQADISCIAAPTIPSATYNFPLCYGDTLQLNAGGSTANNYTWTGPNGFTSSLQNPTIGNVNSNHSGFYKVVAEYEGLYSDTMWVEVWAYPIPATPPIFTNSPVCNGGVLNITTDPLLNGSYQWSGPAAFASNVQNPTIISVNENYEGSYQLVLEENGCYSDTAQVSVIINTVPQATVSNTSPVCAGDSVSIIASTIGGGIYEWTGPAGFQSNQQSPWLTGTTTAQSGSYSLVVELAGCYSDPVNTQVTINPIPATPAIYTDALICVDSTLTLSTDVLANGNYYWDTPTGLSGNTQTVIIPNIDAGEEGVFTLVVEENGCLSDTASTYITIQAVDIPTLSFDSTACEGDTIIISCLSIADTYNWTGPNGFVSTLQNPSLDSVLISQSGSYTLSTSINSCPSEEVSASLEVYSIPAPPQIWSNSPICEGDTLKLEATLEPWANCSWLDPQGTIYNNPMVSFANADNTQSGTYQVSQTLNSCTSEVEEMVVEIKAMPEIIGLYTNSPICEGDSLILFVDDLAGQNYSWTGPNGFETIASDTSVQNTSTQLSGTYFLEAELDFCFNDTSIEVTVNPIPVQPIITQNDSIISTDVYFAYQWFDTQGEITGATDQEYMPLINGDYYVFVENEYGCTNSSDPFTFIIEGIDKEDDYVVSIYPNPAKDVLYIEWPSEKHNGSTLSLINTLGQTLIKQNVKADSNVNSINLEGFTSGVYFLQFSINEKEYRKKIVVNK